MSGGKVSPRRGLLFGLLLGAVAGLYLGMACGKQSRIQRDVVSTVDYSDDPASEREAEKMLVESINQARTDAGLASLPENARLTELARSHSRDMMTGNYIGHTSPTAGPLKTRAVRFGIAAKLLLENVAVDVDFTNVMSNLLHSPAHRKAILDKRVNAVGVGVAIREEADGLRKYFITQEFARFE